MVRLARKPGPSAPIPLFSPIARLTGPLTTTSWPAGCVVTAWPCRLNAGSSTARAAATTTGKYAGRQPARTAQAATRSSVASPIDGGTNPRDTEPSAPPSIASTRSGVGGTTGRPSVQPRSNISSISSSARWLEIAAAISGSMADFDEQPGLYRGSVAGGPARAAEPSIAAACPISASRAG